MDSNSSGQIGDSTNTLIENTYIFIDQTRGFSFDEPLVYQIMRRVI
jgi:hypothetical protein